MKITSDEFDGSLSGKSIAILNRSPHVSPEMTFSASIQNNFFVSNMYHKLIENERRLFLELLVNNFLQISVQRDDPNKSSNVFDF